MIVLKFARYSDRESLGRVLPWDIAKHGRGIYTLSNSQRMVIMGIIPIAAPARLPEAQFEVGAAPPAVGNSPSPRLWSKEAFASPDGAVSTGTWEASPGRFAPAVVDAEFCHFVAGRATFVADEGQTFESAQAMRRTFRR